MNDDDPTKKSRLPSGEDGGWSETIHTGEWAVVPTTGKRKRVIEDTSKLLGHWKRYTRAAWEEASKPQRVVGAGIFVTWHYILWLAQHHWPHLYQLMVLHGGR